MRRAARLLVALAPLAAILVAGCASGDAPAQPEGGRPPLTPLVLRLAPGQDLKREVMAFARERDLRAGILLTCVGSLTRTALRYADRAETTILEGKREIVSLVGTVTAGGCHLHLSVSDGEGRTVGGHLMDGSLVYTTAEVAIGEAGQLRFALEKDPTFGYHELKVEQR